MTPIRRQYLRIKGRYPDALVLFRLGDFYETFDEDARVASRDLDIVLTSKSMGQGLKVPLAGIPAHSLESYLARLIKKGHRVAVCEQLSDPAASKGLVERDVVRVVTPGTVVSPSLLEPKSNNYLTALAVDGDAAGLAYVDITTGEFAATQLSLPDLPLELDRLSPAELLVPPTSLRTAARTRKGSPSRRPSAPSRPSTRAPSLTRRPVRPCWTTSGCRPWRGSAARTCPRPCGPQRPSSSTWPATSAPPWRTWAAWGPTAPART